MASTSGDSVTRTFVLNTARHGHLIKFLDEVRAKDPRGVSKVVRAALELYLERQEIERRQRPVTVQEIEAACQRAIEQALKGRVVEVAESGLSTETPETEAAGRLQEMRVALEEWE